MASTKITLEDAKDSLKEFDNAFRNFYKNSNEHIKIANERKKSKTHLFYRQASKDVKEFVDPNGFSSSWIWGLFIDEQGKKPKDKRRYFDNTYLEYFEKLIIFYQDHIFIENDQDKNAIYQVNDATNSQFDTYRDSQENNLKIKKGGLSLKGIQGDTPIKIKPQSKFKNFISNYWKHGVLGIVVISFGFYIVTTFQNYTENQHRIEEDRNSIENAKIKSSSRTTLLTNMYSEIDKELKTNSNHKLSESLIARIISLSEAFTPYKYLKNEAIIDKPLSLERAILFKNLIEFKLNTETYRKIFHGANFSHSDFSGLNLSSLNLKQLITGISGSHNNQVNGLISFYKRPNFQYANFNQTNLTNAELYGDFSHSDFKGATLKEVGFYWSKGIDIDFRKSDFYGTFENSDFRSSNFENSKLNICIVDSDFRSVNFNNCEIYNYFPALAMTPEDKLLKRSDLIVTMKTFDNVFLSDEDLAYNYIFSLNSFSSNSKTATVGFRESASLNQSKERSFKFVTISELAKTENGYLLKNIDSTSNFIGSASDKKKFIESWLKNSKSDDDLYYQYINKTSNQFVLNENTTIIIGKNFLAKLNRKNPYYEDANQLDYIKSKEKPASFNNTQFYHTTFETKLNSVSFKGATFTNSYFNNTMLFDNDFTNTKGDFYFDSKTIFDSLQVDKNFFWINLDKNIHKTGNATIEDSDIKVEDYVKLNQVEKNKFSRLDIYMSDSLKTYYTLKAMQDRIQQINTDKSHYLIRDKDYLKILKQYKSLTDSIPPNH